jgi:hypothetical protein
VTEILFYLCRDNPGGRGPALYASEHQSSFEEDEGAGAGAASRQRSTVASEKSDATSESGLPGENESAENATYITFWVGWGEL